MESVVFEKSKNFALRIIALYKYFCDEKREFILSKQLLRSGTSIGANIAEANCACSRKDFLAKMHIAFKESAETAYWLELLYKAQYLTQTQYDSKALRYSLVLSMLSSGAKSEKSVGITESSFLVKTLRRRNKIFFNGSINQSTPFFCMYCFILSYSNEI